METGDRSGTVKFDASPDHRVQLVFALCGLPGVLLLAFPSTLVRQLFPQLPHDFDLFFQFDLFIQSKKRPGRLAARPLSGGLRDPDFSFGIQRARFRPWTLRGPAGLDPAERSLARPRRRHPGPRPGPVQAWPLQATSD